MKKPIASEIRIELEEELSDREADGMKMPMLNYEYPPPGEGQCIQINGECRYIYCSDENLRTHN